MGGAFPYDNYDDGHDVKDGDDPAIRGIFVPHLSFAHASIDGDENNVNLDSG